MTVTGPSSRLKIACNIPVLGCFAGGERWVRAAARVAGLTAEVPRARALNGWRQTIGGPILVPVTIVTDQGMNLPRSGGRAVPLRGPGDSRRCRRHRRQPIDAVHLLLMGPRRSQLGLVANAPACHGLQARGLVA